ncbi:encapsidation protein 22K [Human adenovirus 12]|uniref:Encapsidation protein 22K n=1 Tax=Human adenovirus A serotype 12 TaxID=28282 RepID=A0A3G8W4R8_ADE12|nr:encapsidation protein 22K [Human adenovirus 12]
MSPKAAKQAIAQQRSKKQQQRQEIWEEESWESQAEDEVEDLEEWEEEEEADSLDEDPEEEEGSKDGATAAKPSLSTKPSPMKPAVSKSQKASRRWDTIETSAANLGKNRKQARRGYCSWRAHKSNIVACLQHCGGNISFARRYLLYHDGVAIPRNVLHYYRHLYSPFEELDKEPTCNSQAAH